MRYLDSKERSAQHLRTALPLMTRQSAALHPISYAVWYEHVSGMNPELSRALNKMTRADGTIDEEQTWSLYSEYVIEPDSEARQQLSDGFTKMMEGIAESTALADQETCRFDHSLSGWIDQLLEEDAGTFSPGEVLQEMLTGTREIRGAMSSLHERLDASQHEIRRLREEVQRAREEAYLDELTGLANRRAFERRLDTAMFTATQGHEPCLILIDIDHFKRINDNFGHPFGDQVLRAVAQTLKKETRELDLAARVGGEEFAILLHATSRGDAMELAERLRARIASASIRRGAAAVERVTISLGVTQWMLGEPGQSFFERADRALYTSKRDGRNRVTVFQRRTAPGQELEQPLPDPQPQGLAKVLNLHSVNCR